MIHNIYATIFFISALLIFPKNQNESKITESVSYVGEYTVNLFPEDTKSISPYLMGFNLVYVHETDAIWSGDKLTGYMNEISTSVYRWPGGTVCTFYHWNDLTGEGWKDSWDPVNPVQKKPLSAFMDVDEFIAVSGKTNALPLVGINMSSGRRWNRAEDGINEALALMNYLKDKSFHVTYYYLDNEPYMDDANGGSKTIEEYAALVNLYANAMREVDPNIKIIVNWRQAFENRRTEYQKLFSVAGHNIDVVDVHWYWNYSTSSMSEWLAKTPMVLWTGDSYLEEIEYFRQMVTEFGFPDTKLASLEWNSGAITSSTMTPHQCALVQSEMLMHYIEGGLDIATLWPLQWPNTNITLRTFYNRYTSSPQPSINNFRFIGKLQGSDLLKKEVIKNYPKMLMVAGYNNDDDVLRVCIMNKNAGDVKTDLKCGLFGLMNLEEAKAYTLTGSGTGSQVISIDLTEHSSESISLVSPGISMVMLTFKLYETSTFPYIPNEKTDIKIYPNPAKSVVNIEFEENISGSLIKLYNSAGQMVTCEKIPANQNLYNLDISSHNKGLYFILFESGNKKCLKKLVINN